MATEKLSEGIRKFADDQMKLEAKIKDKINALLKKKWVIKLII